MFIKKRRITYVHYNIFFTTITKTLIQLDPFFRPYDGKWSKSMVGYGPEDDHFVIELTYNYGIGSYQLGNDFKV